MFHTYTHLSYVSMVGIGGAILGGILMIGYLTDTLASGGADDSELKLFNIVGVFANIGIAVFCFEGNGIVINLKAEARNQSRYYLILKLAILTVISWYMLLATISYITFRNSTAEYVTSNLELNPFTIIINILFCLNALTSYPVQILCCF